MEEFGNVVEYLFSDYICAHFYQCWTMPEVLKQVWDLSDQDNDSMLSLREFCIALYLMERYREGHPLPPTLPTNISHDETLLSLTGQPMLLIEIQIANVLPILV